MVTTHVLVVDDEEDLREIPRLNSEIEGYEVDITYNTGGTLKKDLTVCNLLLLDVMMRGISDFGMACILRQDEKTANTPIIFLTAKNTENDMLTGLDLGADDYISKPFSACQVIMRVKAVLGRISRKSEEREIGKLEYGTLALDVRRIKATVDEVEVPLARREFEILKLPLEDRGNVFSREGVLPRTWKDEVYVLSRTIDVSITRLRKGMNPYGRNTATRLGPSYCFEC